MTKNVFVVGADDYNCKLLEDIHADKGYEFHNLLTFDEVKAGGRYPSFDKLINQAETILDRFEGSIDAIVGYWDFPVNLMVPILCARYGLNSPTLESELKCDHKYWSRLEQQTVIPEHTPGFEALDPFDDEAVNNIQMAFPFWIKPVKSTDSFLAFKVTSADDLEQALQKTREKIKFIGAPFNELLAHATLPDRVAVVDGNHCIIEEMIGGHQCTVEGHAINSEIIAHGVIDSFHYPGSSSFLRYEYPSELPSSVQEAMIQTSQEIMSHIGFDNGAFNIEYFYDRDHDDYNLLEINPRISQSHSEMFRYVDGMSNHRIMVELALGNKPDFRPGGGQFKCSAKFYLRRFEDGRMSRVPSADELEALKRSMSGIDIDVKASKGTQLSQMLEQDSYSFDLAHIYVGADSSRALVDKFHQVVEALPIEFEGEQDDRWKQAALTAE